MAALLWPPLAGSRMFPFSAFQEKVHFMVAAQGRLDRFDGNENPAYFEDIRKHMERTFAGWDAPLNLGGDYLQFDSPTLARDFERKFPFAGHRFGQSTWSSKDSGTRIQRGQVGASNTPPRSEPRPNQVGSFVASSSRRQPRIDPQRSEEELRTAKVGFY